MSKISLPKIWLTFSEVYLQFNDVLIQALKDGIISAEGRYVTDEDIFATDQGTQAINDDGSLILRERQIITPHIWETYDFIKSNWSLKKDFSTKRGESGFYEYIDIRFKADDLERFLKEYSNDPNIEVSKAAPARKRTRDDEIYLVIGEIVRSYKKSEGEFPSANQAWGSLERRQNEFDCIDEITTSRVAKEEVILWSGSNGSSHRMTRATFANVLSSFVTGKRKLPA